MSFFLSLFSSRLDTAKFKATLNSAGKRAQVQRNKALRDATDAQREILELFVAGREEKARIRAETMLHLQKMEISYDIVETLCSLLSTRASYLASLRQLPEDLHEHVAALLFAAPRVDIPELFDVAEQLRKHFRKDKRFPTDTPPNLKDGESPPPPPALVLRLTFLMSTAPPSAEEVDQHLANIRALLPAGAAAGTSGGPSRPGGGGGGGGGVRIPELPKVGKPLGAAPKAPVLDELISSPAAAEPATTMAPTPVGDEDLLARLNRLKNFKITAEVNLQALRVKLAENHFYEPFTAESYQLVDRMLSDLLVTTERYKELEQRAESFKSQLANVWRQNADLSQANLDLQRTNADLHAHHMAFREEHELKNHKLHSQVFALQDANEQLQLVLVQESFSKTSIEQLNHNLKRRLNDLVSSSSSSLNHVFKGELPVYQPPPPSAAPTDGRRNQTQTAEVGRLEEALQMALAENARLRATRYELPTMAAFGGAQDEGEESTEKVGALKAEVTRLNKVVDHLNEQYQEMKRMRTRPHGVRPAATRPDGGTTTATTATTTEEGGGTEAMTGLVRALEMERAHVRALTRRLEGQQQTTKGGGTTETPPPTLERLSEEFGVEKAVGGWQMETVVAEEQRMQLEKAGETIRRLEREKKTLETLLEELQTVKRETAGERKSGKAAEEAELREAYEAALVVLETQVKEYKLMVGTKEEEIRDLKSQLSEEVEEKLAELSEVVEKLAEENNRLTRELENAGNRYKNELVLTRGKIVHAEESVVEFEKTVVALRRELKETLMIRRHLEEELVIERNTVEELRNQVSVKKDECKRMESLVSTIDMSKSDLIHRLAVSEREIEKYKREVQESVSESSARVAELEILRKDLVEYKEHMLFLSKQKDEMQSVCDDQAERLDHLNQQLRQQELGQVEVHRTLENHKRRVVQLEEQLASKEDSIRSLSSRLSMASDELTRTASELVQRKRELTDAMDDVRVLVDETNKFKNLLGDSDRSLQTSRRDSADIKKRIDAVLQALRATELERDDVLTLYRQSIQDLDHCKFVLSTVDREKSQLQTAVADALKAIEETRYRESSLRQEIATRDLDIAALKDRLQLVTVQLDQMLADSEEGRRGVGRLMHELKMQEELNRIVEDHKVAFEREIARLENDAHHLATKLKSTQNLLEQKTQALQDAEERYNVLAAYRAAAASDQDERPQQSAGGVSELLQTIEQQYRMIGELDSEVEQLKTKLKSRGDA